MNYALWHRLVTFLSWLISTSKKTKVYFNPKNPPDPKCPRWNRKRSISINHSNCLPYSGIGSCDMHLLTKAGTAFNTILPHSHWNWMNSSLICSEYVPAMPPGKEGSLGIVWKPVLRFSKNYLSWLAMNGEAHNFVYWNWLMMSSSAKRILRIVWRRGLAMSK